MLAIAYVPRMVGNSTDPRSWVRWWTPLGWVDELAPYGDPDLRALVPPLVVPLVLATVAVLLRSRQDTAFTHLAWVPMDPWAATAGIVMTAIGLVLLAIGRWAFRRRDLVED